jgi:phenylalanyl-tRNA synthetase beta chain
MAGHERYLHEGGPGGRGRPDGGVWIDSAAAAAGAGRAAAGERHTAVRARRAGAAFGHGHAKHFDDFRLFEIGREIRRREGGLPEERPHLAAAIYAKNGDGAAGLFELKRAAEALMPGAECRPAEARSYEHPWRAAEIHWRGRSLARLFELHPRLMETGRAAILDADLEQIRELSAADTRYTPVRRFPSSAFDLSVVAPVRELSAALQQKIAAHAGELLESIEFLRQYSGPPLQEGMKSVSYRLTLAAPDRTLASNEVTAVRNRIIEGMRSAGYELRV